MKTSPLNRTARLGLLAAAVLVTVVLQAACGIGGAEATFERALKVDGPVRLDVSTGSGRIVIRNGASGEVRIHGEVRARGLFMSSGVHRAQRVADNPSIEQSENLIRVGGGRSESPFAGVSISYTIDTPADTQVSTKNGSGGVEISGLRGPVRVIAGSGGVRVDDVGDNVTLTVGSGGIRASRIRGNVTFTSGSGPVVFSEVSEEIRGNAGSGGIEVDRARGRVNIHTGSGGIRMTGASQDVRAATGSGTIRIYGNPASDAFWDLGAGSGGIELAVPGSASFALTARTSSGNFQVDMPISIEEQSRRFLRARVGDGKAHINLETKSGNIRIQQGGTS